jgi:hypothetical protein
MAVNHLFAASDVLDGWIATARVELSGNVLSLRPTGERYAVEEGVQIVREVTGGGDPRALVGRVRTLRDLLALGAEVVGRAMVLGEAAYDVVPGFVLTPVAAPAPGVPTARAVAVLSRLSEDASRVQSDEDLLARYLIDKLE